jgi:antitoxin PrlF
VALCSPLCFPLASPRSAFSETCLDLKVSRYYDIGYRKENRMVTETTLTSKGQVTVPREIRDRLGLASGDKLAFTMLSDGTVVMRAKTRRLIDLAGTLTRPGQPTVSIAQMKR